MKHIIIVIASLFMLAASTIAQAETRSGGQGFGGGGGGPAPKAFGGVQSKSFQGGPGIAPRRSFQGKGAFSSRQAFRRPPPGTFPRHHRRHRHKGHYYYWYGYPYIYGFDSYGYGECAWLYRKAVATDSAYWWRRYYECIGYY
jgi:hypothetical protein